MATTEELIAGLRAAGERMPRKFIRAGLLYELQTGNGDFGDYYTYEPVESFHVDGIRYSNAARAPGLMFTSVLDGGSRARMDHSRPPTEYELDRWVRNSDRQHILRPLHTPSERSRS